MVFGLSGFRVLCRYHELKHVAIVGNADYVAREWDSLSNLPRISVLHGSPMCRADLRSVNINLCDLCIILSARVSAATDPGMADKVGHSPFQEPFTIQLSLCRKRSWPLST